MKEEKSQAQCPIHSPGKLSRYKASEEEYRPLRQVQGAAGSSCYGLVGHYSQTVLYWDALEIKPSFSTFHDLGKMFCGFLRKSRLKHN